MLLVAVPFLQFFGRQRPAYAGFARRLLCCGQPAYAVPHDGAQPVVGGHAVNPLPRSRRDGGVGGIAHGGGPEARSAAYEPEEIKGVLVYWHWKVFIVR